MKTSKQIKRKGNIENWWSPKICQKCVFWNPDYAENWLDKYAGCTKFNLKDYQIKKCLFTRDKYIEERDKVLIHKQLNNGHKRI